MPICPTCDQETAEPCDLCRELAEILYKEASQVVTVIEPKRVKWFAKPWQEGNEPKD